MIFLAKMTEMERRNGYCKDVDGQQVKYCAMVSLGEALMVLLTCAAMAAVVFSSWESADLWEYRDVIGGIWDIAICLTLIYTLARTFREYDRRHERCFFYADIPKGVPGWGWIILLMCICLPVYIGSFIRMKIWDFKYGRQIGKVPEIMLQTVDAEQAYQQYYRDAWPIKRAAIVAGLKEEAKTEAQTLKQLENELAKLEDNIASQKERLQKTEKAYRDWEKRSTPAPDTETCTKILQLKGVQQVTYLPRPNSTLKQLCIDVCVYYQVRGYFYDLGDYQIRLMAGAFECCQTRSGRRPDVKIALAEYVDTEGHFRFGGERLAEILEMVKYGTYYDAVAGIVAELHKIDDIDVASIPKCFQRVGRAD